MTTAVVLLALDVVELETATVLDAGCAVLSGGCVVVLSVNEVVGSVDLLTGWVVVVSVDTG